MSDKQEVHVHHHYAPKAKTKPRKKKVKKNSPKKVISVVINIIEELVRLT